MPRRDGALAVQGQAGGVTLRWVLSVVACVIVLQVVEATTPLFFCGRASSRDCQYLFVGID